jgi:hypothetical protein
LQLLYLIAFTLAINVIDGTKISSSSLGFKDLIASCSEELPLIRAQQYFALVIFFI